MVGRGKLTCCIYLESIMFLRLALDNQWKFGGYPVRWDTFVSHWDSLAGNEAQRFG